MFFKKTGKSVDHDIESPDQKFINEINKENLDEKPLDEKTKKEIGESLSSLIKETNFIKEKIGAREYKETQLIPALQVIINKGDLSSQLQPFASHSAYYKHELNKHHKLFELLTGKATDFIRNKEQSADFFHNFSTIIKNYRDSLDTIQQIYRELSQGPYQAPKSPESP